MAGRTALRSIDRQQKENHAVRFAVFLILGLLVASGALAQGHAERQRAQQRHSNEMNRQGYLNQQRQMQGQQMQPGAPQGDPMADMMSNLSALIQIQRNRMNAAMGTMKALAADPRFQKLHGGYWTYYQEGNPPVPGQKCTATFANMDGMLSIAGLGGYKDPALLLLTGKDVPNPRREGRIQAVLHQSGERPQRVSVHNFTHPRMGLGTVAFAVPNLEAAVQGLEDKAEIGVDVNNVRIYTLRYHSGKQVGTQLQRCAKRAR
ncbi:hypothetical protein [Nitratireductor sp. ZSWI3]|uniref:hypothetical protein n=1 Tax=Nitratireductor sp. ZSWI3 TaxID=2966359 RepID=UPI00215011B9|nr:hypothetical protein [Nitratireductor sp. ZSWI3]MCR4266550.1 hypothetical protein [Nitratireductor sp. ZSWI3]